MCFSVYCLPFTTRFAVGVVVNLKPLVNKRDIHNTYTSKLYSCFPCRPTVHTTYDPPGGTRLQRTPGVWFQYAHRPGRTWRVREKLIQFYPSVCLCGYCACPVFYLTNLLKLYRRRVLPGWIVLPTWRRIAANISLSSTGEVIFKDNQRYRSSYKRLFIFFKPLDSSSVLQSTLKKVI